jgi:hypothetical protein
MMIETGKKGEPASVQICSLLGDRRQLLMSEVGETRLNSILFISNSEFWRRTAIVRVTGPRMNATKAGLSEVPFYTK